MRHDLFFTCHEALKANNTAALWFSAWHGCPWENHETPFCSEDIGFPYLHIFCTNEGLRRKKQMALEIGIWFVQDNASGTVVHNGKVLGGFRRAPWRDLIVPTKVHKGKKFCLPCSEYPSCLLDAG